MKKALYIRSTKTRCTSMYVNDFDVTHDVQPLSEGARPMLTIKLQCDDGKKRQVTFYGDQIQELKKKMEPAQANPMPAKL